MSTVDDLKEMVDRQAAELERQVAEGDTKTLTDDLLDIEIYGRRRSGGEWDMTHVVVVFSTGGPHIELDTATDRVVGYWGGNTCWRGVHRKVGEFFEELVDS